ncbi:MAG: ectonucleotide pyrophosphatase/phosphodiesterase [Bacteroidales bacterium]|nr:ectonucleotide pyrophosphatase/phosphodiesterase [Bacteroidales bacterium]
MRITWRVVFLLMLVLASSCRKKEKGTQDTYVVVVSFDGFRWDYTDLYATPNFNEMAKAGVKAEYLLSSFPTKTFPNHYTLATGLYPDHHGIINNSFYASDLDGIYRIGDSSMVTDPDSYFGEPVWVTAEKQGVRSASYFWVGSEAAIGGVMPSYWYPYEESVPYLSRVDQLINWLKLPLPERPGLVFLYFDEPDGIAHDYGPEHPETGKMVTYLDSVLGYLRSEIAALEYGELVNLLVLSDHGMGPTSSDKYVNLEEHLKGEWTRSIVGGNPVYLIQPQEACADSITTALNRLEGVTAWQKEDIPERLHYGSSPRFPGIVVVADSLWSIGTRPDPSGYTGGAHGYDNAFTDMRAIFYAEGPAFKKACQADPFSNVEVYGIIAEVLGLDPAPSDGNPENVRSIFR